jgi:hypothetical protein
VTEQWAQRVKQRTHAEISIFVSEQKGKAPVTGHLAIIERWPDTARLRKISPFWLLKTPDDGEDTIFNTLNQCCGEKIDATSNNKFT